MDRGETENAIRAFDDAIRGDPNDAVAYRYRGQAHYQRGEFDKAMLDFDTAIQINPHDAMAYAARGVEWIRQAKVDKAMVDFNFALHFNPEVAEAHFRRGTLWIEKGDADRARSDYEKAIYIDRKYLTDLRTSGYAHFNAGQFEASALEFSVLARFWRTDQDMTMFRYIAQFRAGHPNEAINEYVQSVAPLDRKRWPGPIVDFLLGRLDVEILYRAAEQPSESTRGRKLCALEFYVGQWHILNRRPREARFHIERAVRECPTGMSLAAASVAELKRLDSVVSH